FVLAQIQTDNHDWRAAEKSYDCIIDLGMRHHVLEDGPQTPGFAEWMIATGAKADLYRLYADNPEQVKRVHDVGGRFNEARRAVQTANREQSGQAVKRPEQLKRHHAKGELNQIGMNYLTAQSLYKDILKLCRSTAPVTAPFDTQLLCLRTMVSAHWCLALLQ